MASSAITSWQIDGEIMETVTDFIFLSSQITAVGDYSQKIQKCLLLGRKAMTKLDSTLKSRDITLHIKVCLGKAMVFQQSCRDGRLGALKKAECQRIDLFKFWCWRRLLRVPWIASSILGTYWPGEFLFQYPIILPFHTVHATGDQWRNNSRKNEGMEPKQKQYPVVDVTAERSKVLCCKEQYCIGTWNVRSMNQGKLEVVKQEMARMNRQHSRNQWTKMDRNGWI